MPQLTTTTSTPTGYVIATMQAAINSLITNMQAGKDVIAADIAAINSSVYNLWRSHGHTATDRQGIDTFGNLTVYGVGGSVVSTSTTGISPAMGAVTTPAGVAAGQQINAADINVLIAACNLMRVHYHTITDSVGATHPNVVLIATTFDSLNYSVSSTTTVTLQNDGGMAGHQSSGYVAIGGQWIDMRPVDAPTAAQYACFATHISGPLPSGTFGSWVSLSTSRSWSITTPYIGGPNSQTSVIQLQVRDVNTLAVVATANMTLIAATDDTPFITCFPAGSQVLRPDGSWTPIEQIVPGDVVMGVDGPVAVAEMDRPTLGNRKMLSFQDGSLNWSEEHAMWTRNAAKSEWWWSYNRNMWIKEAVGGHIGGLKNNNTMRTGAQAAEWAHVSGWKANTVVELPKMDQSTRLYLPRTDGSPIIVNGYVVGAGVNEAGYDYTKLNWDAVYPTLPVVQPLPAA